MDGGIAVLIHGSETESHFKKQPGSRAKLKNKAQCLHGVTPSRLGEVAVLPNIETDTKSQEKEKK